MSRGLPQTILHPFEADGCVMKLLYQTHSPYARKVLVAAHETGLAGQLEVIHQPNQAE